MKIPQVKFYQGYPVVTAEKAKYIDRIATLDYGITEKELMENAGMKSASEIELYVKENLKKDITQSKIFIMCGRGNNGGDGLVCSRYLKNKGADVNVFMVKANERGYSMLVVENLEKAKEAGVSISLVDFDNLLDVEEKLKHADIIVDALLGIGAVGKPVGIVKRLIQIANKSLKDIISLDIPSGLIPDTGHHTGVFIKAKMTLTFGFPKSGLMAAHAQKNTGIIKVIDIGYPPELYDRVKRDVEKS